MEAQRENRTQPQRPSTLPQQPSTSTATHPLITNIKNFHDEGYLYIQQGLSCDERGQGEQAVMLYKKGIRCIDLALDIPSDGPGCTGPQWEKVKLMKNKMQKTKTQITSRVDDILQNDMNAARSLTDPPPSYEVATSPQVAEDESMSQFDSYFDSVDGTGTEQAQVSERMGNAVEIFSIPDGVQIYFISSNGFVSAPSYPSSLGIYRLRDQAVEGASNVQTPPAFLSIGNWTYPLLPGRSPALRAETGTYVFPDVNSPDEGASVGVIIPDTVPPNERARLQGLLNYLTDLRTMTRAEPQAEPEEPEELTQEEIEAAIAQADERRTSTQISKGIVTAAEWISWGLEKGAEKTGEWLKMGSSKLREQLTPESEPRQVDPRTQQGMKYARKATDSAVKVSAYIVDGLGKATLALGRQVAPHIRKQGEKYLPKSMTAPSDGQSKMDAVMEVAAGGLVGFGTVWNGLETAGKALGRSIANETVSVVKHKYGHQVGDTTHDALYTVGNTALTAHNAKNLGIKAIAKRAAKDTGKAVLEDYKKARQMKEPSPQEDLLPPGRKGNGGSGAPPRPPPPAGGHTPMLQ